MLLRFGSVTLMVAALAACADASRPGYDGGFDDASVRMYTLAFETPSPLRAGTGAVVPVRVRVRDDSGAVVTNDSDTVVTFGIFGTASGSALLESEVSIDDEGYATTRIATGRLSGRFYIRVTTPRALPIGMDVVVDPAAVATFDVSATYAGNRTLGILDVALVPGGDCSLASTLSAMGDPLQGIPQGMTSSTIVVPASGVFAVVIHAHSPLGGFAAAGCEHGFVSVEGMHTSVVVPLEDTLVFVDEPLSGDLDIEGHELAKWLSSVAYSGMTARIATKLGDAGLLYAALEAELRSRGEGSNADAVAGFNTPGARASLDGTLHGQGEGATQMAADFRDALHDFEPRIRLTGLLSFPRVDEPSFAVSTSSIVVGEVAVPVYDDVLGLDGQEIALPGVFAVQTAAYHVTNAEIPFASQYLATAFLEAMNDTLPNGLRDEFMPTLGCDAIFDVPEIAPYCTTSACRTAFCERAFESLRDAADVAFAASNAARTLLSLSGTVELLDTNLDDKVDAAQAQGQPALWQGETPGSETESTFSLLAMSPLATVMP